MQTPSSKSLMVKTELPPKSTFEIHNLQIGSTSSELPKITQEPQKADPKPQIAKKKDEPRSSSDAKFIYNESSKGESSKSMPFSLSLSGHYSQHPIMCKFCSKQFSSTQALGGHQNAHRQEREMQKAMKVAHDFSTNPLLHKLSDAMLPHFPGPYIAQQHQYHPRNGFVQRASRAKTAVYSHPGIGLSWGAPGLRQVGGRFIGSSSMRPMGTAFNPGWPTPHASQTGPTARYNGLTNFNPLAGFNSTAFLQTMANEANISKRQRMESSGQVFLKHPESTKIDRPPNCNETLMTQNESTKLDLTLKLY